MPTVIVHLKYRCVPELQMLLEYIHQIFFSHDAIYFAKCTSHSCSKACASHNTMLPPLYFTVGGILKLASFPHFPSNIPLIVMTKQFNFKFHQLTGYEWLFSSGRYRTRFTVDNNTTLPVSASILTRSFCCCSGADLPISHQNTFISRTRNLSTSRLLPVYSHPVYTCILSFKRMNVGPSGI